MPRQIDKMKTEADQEAKYASEKRREAEAYARIGADKHEREARRLAEEAERNSANLNRRIGKNEL